MILIVDNIFVNTVSGISLIAVFMFFFLGSYYWYIRPRILKKPRLTKAQARRVLWLFRIPLMLVHGGVLLLFWDMSEKSWLASCMFVLMFTLFNLVQDWYAKSAIERITVVETWRDLGFSGIQVVDIEK